jgi:hypothetical protein
VGGSRERTGGYADSQFEPLHSCKPNKKPHPWDETFYLVGPTRDFSNYFFSDIQLIYERLSELDA